MIPLEWTARHQEGAGCFGVTLVRVKETAYPWRSAHIYISDHQKRTLRPSQLSYLVLGWAAVTVEKYRNGQGVLA